MIYQLSIPQIDNVEELRVLQWHKNEGEQIGSDELIVELESAKAVVEVRSPRRCVLRKIEVADNAWAPIGPALAWFSDLADELLQVNDAQDFVAQWEAV